jgi:hypothetical protein
MKLRSSLGFLLLLIATSLIAQTFRGTILGTVTDPQGAVIPGAKVTVHNINTGLERTTQTSADGSYSVPELPIGTYNVTATQSGFQTAVISNVAVDVAAEKRVDFVFRTGQVSEKVEVSGETLPEVETTTDTLGTTFTAEQAKNLPLNGRDFQKMIFLTPGVAGSPDEITDSPGSFGIFSMNGARGRSNNFLLDGTDMNDGYRNDPAINEAGVFGTPATILPVDAIEETQISSNFMPEYGRNAGAAVNIVTKSGTNTLHGSLIEYFRNSALDARNYFDPVSTPKAPFHNNQFGGSLGGPIVKDKTFFYLNYEGQRERVGVVTQGCVPDPRQIALDGGASNSVIAALLARDPWPAPNLSVLYDPSNPAHDFNSGCPTGPNASVISPSYNRVDSMIAKIDHNINSRNLVTGRYFFGDSSQAFPLALTASGGQLPGFNTFTPTRVQLVSLSHVWTLSGTKVNELRFGWNRFAEDFLAQDNSFHPSSIGLNVGSGLADDGLPIILVSGFSQLGATSGDPRGRVDSNNQLIDNFSWKANQHDIKFGAEYRRTTIKQYFDKYFRGKLSFKDTVDPITGLVITPALQNFLTGVPSTDFGASFQYSGDTLRHTAENSYGFYLQDTYRATSRLTLNYGLRWDYFGVVLEKNNLFSNATTADPATGAFVLTQVGQPGLGRLYEPDHKNFSPRVSLAWDATGRGKTVLRAGWGLFYDAFSQDIFLGHLPYPPFFDPGPAYNPVGPEQIIPSANTTGTITAGQPVFDSSGCGTVECDIFTVDRHIHTPYMENYNVNLQQQLSSKTVLLVSYVGSQGHHLFRFRDISQPSQATITASDIAAAQSIPGCFPAGGPGCGNSYGAPRTFNFPYGSFYIMQEESTAKSNYNALQTSLRVNQWRGITSIVNYTWSHSQDTASDLEDFEPNAAQPYDSTRPNLEYGNSNFDVRNRFTWIFGYQLPNMGLSRLKNGWGFTSALTLQSGQPFQMNYNFEDDFSGAGEGIDRPDVVGPIVYHKNDPRNFIDLSSFAIPCTLTRFAVASPSGTADDCVPGTRHFGNERRNSLVGPAYKNWDFAVYKDTVITERLSMQLRAEFFNLLNHPNFASPFLPLFIADPAQQGFGVNGNREVGTGGFALGATGDVGIGNPFLGGGGPRGIQLAAKFTF